VTTKLVIKKAVKSMGRLRLALAGPSGSGKTLTAIKVASYIASRMGKRVLVIDTERASAAKYADLADFDVIELSETHHPGAYVEALKLAVESGNYAVVVIDSLSHAWVGKDGALALVDLAAKRSQSQNTYTAWRDVTPLHNALVDAILLCPIHVIATLRSKTEYVMEVNERGKSVPRKVGLAPIQRDGMEYEFDIFGDMDRDHNLMISKSRCFVLADKIINRPDEDFAKTVYAWLTEGQPIVEAPATATASADAEATEATATASAPAALSFEGVMELERKRLGPEVFDSVLKLFGYAAYSDITDRAKRVEFYNALQSTQTKEAS